MKLHYLNGPKSGEVVVLTPPAVTLGRETDNDLSLLVEGISRYHAKIDFSDNVWTIRDLGSTNGTKIDGSVIAGPTPLKDGEKGGEKSSSSEKNKKTETTLRH